MATKIYLAGPDVFLPDALEVGRQKTEICRRHGLVGLYPLDNVVDRAAADASLRIFKANEAMMDQADAVIANLTSFRGPGADGVAARGKLCLGYSNDPAAYADRVRRTTKVSVEAGRLTDADGLTVEDFGHNDNLMIIHALDLYGAPLVLPREKPVDIWHDLTAFELCVAMAAARLISAS